MKRMSAKRAKEARVYAERRNLFLADRPICEIWLAEKGWTQITFDGLYSGYQRKSGPMGVIDITGAGYLHNVLGAPYATEIRHRAKRGENYINEATWIAVSRWGHDLVENNKS